MEATDSLRTSAQQTFAKTAMREINNQELGIADSRYLANRTIHARLRPNGHRFDAVTGQKTPGMPSH